MQGENPNQTKRADHARSITLDAAFQQYLGARENLRPTTKQTYRRVVHHYLGGWGTTPLAEITPAIVHETHIRLTRDVGASTANTAMRVFRAIYNYAAAFHDGLPANPVIRLSQARSWNREVRRQTVISQSDLPRWHETVTGLQNPRARDYLLLLLFTGMRRSEAARLRWEHVDLINRTFMVPETKNHDPLILPMSGYIFELFCRRHHGHHDSEWVFPGPGRSGHLEEPQRFVRQVRNISGVEFTLHDLRRTFITIAEELDLSVYAIKRLLNHRDCRDVTAGYIIHSVERLRVPMQRISDRILTLATPQTIEQQAPYDRSPTTRAPEALGQRAQ